MNDYTTEQLYPKLPKDGANFRLQKSCDTLSRLENEEKHYEDLVSKALMDEKVGAEGFSLIIKEVDKFEELKLRVRGQIGVDEKKETNLDVLRTEIRESLIKQLTPTAPPIRKNIRLQF